MTMKVARRGPVQLRFDDSGVTVTPEDQDRFFLTAKQAIKACRESKSQELMIQRFKDEFLAKIHDWCNRHSDMIGECYVASSPYGAVMSVFVIGSTGHYDFSLSDPISDLEISLVDNGWTADVVQLPDGDVSRRMSFFDEEKAIQVYGERRGASSES